MQNNNSRLDYVLKKDSRLKANWDTIKNLSHDLIMPLDYKELDKNILKSIRADSDEQAVDVIRINTTNGLNFEQIVECYMRNVLLCVLFSKWAQNKKSFYIDGKNIAAKSWYLQWGPTTNRLECNIITDSFSFRITSYSNVSDIPIKNIPNYLFSVRLINRAIGYRIEDTAKLSEITTKYIEDLYNATI